MRSTTQSAPKPAPKPATQTCCPTSGRERPTRQPICRPAHKPVRRFAPVQPMPLPLECQPDIELMLGPIHPPASHPALCRFPATQCSKYVDGTCEWLHEHDQRILKCSGDTCPVDICRSHTELVPFGYSPYIAWDRAGRRRVCSSTSFTACKGGCPDLHPEWHFNGARNPNPLCPFTLQPQTDSGMGCLSILQCPHLSSDEKLGRIIYSRRPDRCLSYVATLITSIKEDVESKYPLAPRPPSRRWSPPRSPTQWPSPRSPTQWSPPTRWPPSTRWPPLDIVVNEKKYPDPIYPALPIPDVG